MDFLRKDIVSRVNLDRCARGERSLARRQRRVKLEAIDDYARGRAHGYHRGYIVRPRASLLDRLPRYLRNFSYVYRGFIVLRLNTRSRRYRFAHLDPLTDVQRTDHGV